MQHPRIITLVAASLLMSQVSEACQAETAQQRGKDIAQGLCSRCHAIETTGESPLPAAPRFNLEIKIRKIVQHFEWVWGIRVVCPKPFLRNFFSQGAESIAVPERRYHVPLSGIVERNQDPLPHMWVSRSAA